MCKPEVFDQIQYGGGRHLENHIKRNNSIIFEPIFTEFGSTGSEKLGKQNRFINRKCMQVEIQDGRRRHL